MDFRHFILGLLTQQAMSGYDIKCVLKRLGWLVGNPSFGSIYTNLHALLKDGLVTVKVVANPHKPVRKVYRIAEPGRQVLQKWVNETVTTKASLKKMVTPSLMAIIVPVVFGYISKEALGGLLAGCTVTGVLLAIFQANAGGAWDNAKKYIEEGHHGGKGSEAHKAAVIGDTVGDPFKDTSGPSLNILIKLMSVVALVIAPLIK